jgi:hypothetical protein
MVWGPLGVGGQVDHRATTQALWRLGCRTMYEERPYARQTGAVRAAWQRRMAAIVDEVPPIDVDEAGAFLDHVGAPGRSVAVEEFIEGHEGFYDTISIDGEIVHDFVTHYYPNVLDAMRHRWISPQFITTNRIDAPGYAELKQMGRQVNRALGIQTSPTHMEWFFGPKGLSFSEVQDLRAFRVLVDDVKDCYTVLGIAHQVWPPIPREFDDYISRPKPNGYQSLHTVVIAEDGRPLEVQIRTREMHRHAEFGVASHWRYKETSAPGAAPGPPAGGVARRGRGAGAQDERVEWMRQLLMWQQEVGATLGGRMPTATGGEYDRIYLLTPQAKVVELPEGATPVDFAYHVHTLLGHRCRGARVDRQMVPLNTVLRNGQTVEIVAATAHKT